MPIHIPDVSPWWASLISIPVLGVYAKNYLDTHARIRDAEAETAELKLAVEKRYASKGYLNAVEVRLTKTLDKLDAAIIRLEDKA